MCLWIPPQSLLHSEKKDSSNSDWRLREEGEEKTERRVEPRIERRRRSCGSDGGRRVEVKVEVAYLLSCRISPSDSWEEEEKTGWNDCVHLSGRFICCCTSYLLFKGSLCLSKQIYPLFYTRCTEEGGEQSRRKDMFMLYCRCREKVPNGDPLGFIYLSETKKNKTI